MTAIPTGTVAWSSSETSIATVNPTTGVVLGITQGTARISAVTGGDQSAAQIVTVVNPPSVSARRATDP